MGSRTLPRKATCNSLSRNPEKEGKVKKSQEGGKKNKNELSLQFFGGVREEDNAKKSAKVMQSPAAPLDYFSKCIMTDLDIKKRGEIQCNRNAMLLCPNAKYAVCRLTIAHVQ